MRIFPKLYFSWWEPRKYRQDRDEAERSQMRWWFQPATVLLIMALLAVGWAVAHFNPNKNPPEFSLRWLAELFGISVAFGYGIPLLYRVFPSHVQLFENFIRINRAPKEKRLKYTALSSFAWKENRDYTLLVIRLSDGQEEEVAVPHRCPREAISEFLLSKNLRHDPSLPL